MIQTVKRKEDKRETEERERGERGIEKKKQTFSPCCFLFFLFSFPPFYYGFK